TVKSMQADLAAERPRWYALQARTAIAAGDADSARKMLAQLQATGTDRAKLTELQQAMETQQADARLVSLARRVHAAINAGALTEPAADSAQALVQQMQQLNRNHPLTASAQQELQAALADRARAQQEAAAARARPETSAPAGAAAAPPPPLAAATQAGDDYISAKPAVALDVVYPQRALDIRQQGYVIVEFTLNADGRAADPHVVESSPPAVFDAAALQAVRHGRFDTRALGAVAKPHLARLRISFKP
ncbi:MAG TPA: energy transducer TonB, partial [Burkholderiaceae bacterium]|nr:energy transducer TonB [Burkholderiaceae bacterium]